MHKLILFLACLLWTSLSVGQMIPEFKSKPSSLYVGTNNLIEVQPFQSDLSRIKLKASNAHISKVNDTLYAVNPKFAEGNLKLKLYYKNLPVEIITCEVGSIPNPIVLLNDKVSNRIDKSELMSFLENLDFTFTEEHNLLNNTYQLYNLKINTIEKGILKSFHIQTQNINDRRFRKKLEELSVGDQIVIEYITMIDKRRRTSKFNLNHTFEID